MFLAQWSFIGRTLFQPTDQTIDKGLWRTLQTLSSDKLPLWMTPMTSKDRNTEKFKLDKKFLQYNFFFFFSNCQKLKWFCRYWGGECNHQDPPVFLLYLTAGQRSHSLNISKCFLYKYVVNMRLSCCGVVPFCLLLLLVPWCQLSSLSVVMLIFSY